MSQFIEGCFSWPSYPATILLILVCGYWCLVMLGALDMDIFDFDLDIDLDADVDASILQVGFIPLKWLNIGSVPTMLWLSVFSLAGWMASRLMNSPAPHANLELTTDGLAILRDTGIAAFITKCVTQPLRGRFEPKAANLAKDLIGGICKVTTSEVTESFGEAEYSTDGAPLKLRVRARESGLTRGDVAVIVGFHREQNVYLIKRADSGA
ncbi:MAG: DUF1449 family protein [Planctomycetota bacterium]|nr:DUF1449 family protein [Planctomycetota bacterium]